MNRIIVLLGVRLGCTTILEKNASNEGLNIVGSTSVLNNFHISPVDDDRIPLFPALLLVVDKNNDFIIGNHMTHPYYIAEEFQQYILGLISNKNIIPTKVTFSNSHLFMYLKDLFDRLGVKIELT